MSAVVPSKGAVSEQINGFFALNLEHRVGTDGACL